MENAFLMERPLDEAREKLFQEVGRLKALHDLSLLEVNSETIYDLFTQLAHTVLKTPVSLVSLVAEDYQFFKSDVGLEEPWKSQHKTPLSYSFCQHVVATNQPLIVENALENDLVKDNLAVRELNVMAYLGMPLTLEDGTRLGSFCALDDHVKKWQAVDINIMRELSEIITHEFNVRTAVYINHNLQPELDALHKQIGDLISGLDTRLTKTQFLKALRAARKQYQV